jgi:uncharacterized protein (TIGR00255 family)
MTGYAQVKAQLSEQFAFRLALKSVNHRFLDLHLRMPADSEGLEMKIRRALQARLHRGHVECTLSLDQGGGNGFAVNRELVGGYIAAFRAIAKDFGVVAEPDLNAVFKVPGALETASLPAGNELESAVLSKLEEAITRLDEMRAEEGRGLDRELRERMKRIEHGRDEVEKHSSAVLHAYSDKVQSRMQELVGAHADRDRILQEAAILADRSDIREELVRLQSHVRHFLGLLDKGGEVGKKLDFLLQEMAREANTLLSKTSGVAGEALRITETGLMIKSEIEKAREQAQNVE